MAFDKDGKLVVADSTQGLYRYKRGEMYHVNELC